MGVVSLRSTLRDFSRSLTLMRNFGQTQRMQCPQCHALLEANARFCTSCGLQLEQGAASSKAVVADHGTCVNCGKPLEINSIFCTNCGTRAENTATPATVAPVPPASSSAPDHTVAVPVPASIPAAAAAGPALSASQALPANTPSHTPRHSGPVLLLLLVLAVGLGIAGFLLNRPKASPVLILTPEAPAVSVSSGGSVTLGVGVEGTPTELNWRVDEKNSGRVEPSGVTVQGNRIIYHAIYHAPMRAGDYHVIAANRENKDQAVAIRVEVGR